VQNLVHSNKITCLAEARTTEIAGKLMKLKTGIFNPTMHHLNSVQPVAT
jgi:hypothetical protein